MRTALVVAIALAVVACRPKKDDPDPNPIGGGDDENGLAEDGTDTNAAENDSEALTSTLVGGGGAGGSIGLASSSDLAGGGVDGRTIGDGAKALYVPRGCLTVTSTGDGTGEGTAKYEFNGCTGPAGLFNVKGVVDVTYKATPNHLALDLVGTDLQVNRATVDWSAHAEIDANGAARTMTWKASLTGTTARGRDFSRTNDKTIKWTVGEPCIGLDGVSQGDVRGRNVKTEITAFRRCRGSCPDAGGKIVITNVDKNVSVEIRYDGTNQATLVGPKGGEVKFGLLCR